MSKSLYKVGVYLNARTDGTNYFKGYQTGDPMDHLGEFLIFADDHEGAAEVMFRIGNLRDSGDAKDQEYPEWKRSISVGDVIVVDGTPFACASFGWRQVEFEQLAGE